MTDLTPNFTTIKHQLQSLSSSHESFQQKISQITQTRNKINNEVINLTKDYEKKIKQLQVKLEEVINRNQALLKENKLYRRDIQAYEGRLVEKEKLIAVLVLQQTERYGSDLRNKSDIFDKPEKHSRRNIQSILPKNITQKQQPHHQEEGHSPSAKLSKNKNQPQHSNEELSNQEKVQPVGLDKVDETENNQTPQHQEIKDNKDITNQQQEIVVKQEQKQVQQTQISNPVRKAPPPPPRKGKNRQQQHPAFHNQEARTQNIQESIPQSNIPEQPIKQETSYHNPFEQGDEHINANQQNVMEQQVEQKQSKKQQKQQIHSRPPPPPQRKNKAPAPPAPPKKKAQAIVVHQPQFLQDQHEQPIRDLQKQHEELYRKSDQAPQQNENNFIQNYEAPHKQTQFNMQQNDTQVRQQVHQKVEQSHDFQGTQVHYQMPLANKMAKPNKKKAKTAIKSINQANFYEETSNSHEQSRHVDPQPVIQTHQQAYEYEATPSSEDFFAQFGSASHQEFPTASKSHRSQILEAQQSSIDYADSHSVISSTAANMFDSQYFAEEPNTQNLSTDIKKMSKKKKREIKQLDPGSFN